MSDTPDRMTLDGATRLANTVADLLRPGCDRLEIAGSIRRRKPTVGDLEIVAIAKPKLDLFGGPLGGTMLDPILDVLCFDKRLEKIKGGDRYKQFKLVKAGCKLDLFLASPQTWACVFTIRTGSADFSHRLVTPAAKGGLCPAGFSFSEGRLWRNNCVVELAEEKDLFDVLGLAWIEPEDRK